RRMRYIGLLLLTLLMTQKVWAGTPLDAARTEAGRGDYTAALLNLDHVLQKDPNDSEAGLLQAQIYGWQKNYSEAEQLFAALLQKEPGNADILVAQGYMYYAETKLDGATANFKAALAVAPTYSDATEGLDLINKARRSIEGYKWQADLGGTFSTFERAPQTNWDNEFLQLTRLFSDTGTSVHAVAQRYHQFEQTDDYYEIGADQRFTPFLNGYLYAGTSPDPVFRPRWHIAGGGNVRLTDTLPSVIWLTLDTRYDDYAATDVENLNPGARLEFADNWALSAGAISVFQSGAATTYGWQLRLDGQWSEGWRFYGGYADAPETVAGVTIRTESVFGGVAIDVNDANTVRLGYTRDDRYQSYVRHAIDAAITHRF
ncbi:MAG: YaiO family outer membrane beta-barrel protein, partial [Pseudomonadota bacterium]|nr:YaiO family outer membrane beta-barrel protein [Pseudomonadota bacterium]